MPPSDPADEPDELSARRRRGCRSFGGVDFGRGGVSPEGTCSAAAAAAINGSTPAPEWRRRREADWASCADSADMVVGRKREEERREMRRGTTLRE